jgi:uncharacterized protein (DUF697 family)
MKLPIDVRDIMNSGNKLREDREREVRIAVFVDVEAPDALVEAVRDALQPQTGGAMLHIEACAAGETLLIDPSVDAVIALAGPGAVVERSLAAAREKFVPSVALALGEHAAEIARRLGQPLLDTIVAEEPDEVVHGLGAWLADRVSGKRLALAHNFAFMRRAVAEESVKATAFQNGVIGFVAVIPGADLPLMTANQAKMILQIAAAYGQPLGAERLKELAVVVGGGFTLRAIARQLLDLIPGFGWAVKAGIGYSGTLAMGYAALEYFEEGGDIGGVAQRVKDARDRAVKGARERFGRGLPAEEPLPAHGYVVAGEGGARTEPESTTMRELSAKSVQSVSAENDTPSERLSTGASAL